MKNPSAVWHECAGKCAFFTIRCGKFAVAQRADRVVRPYRTFYVFADGSCNFVIASCRVDVGIDPYGISDNAPFAKFYTDFTQT